MLLLPTLIKLATGKTELPYQISPGIATASKSDMTKLDFVASRVAYLVDGDDGGKTWQGQLFEAGVPKSRVRLLPDGVGLEDLLDRELYLDTVAELGGIDRAQISKAPPSIPIKTAVDSLKLKPKPQGSVAVAEFILGRHESRYKPIVLDPDKKHLLKELDAWVLKTIGG